MALKTSSTNDPKNGQVTGIIFNKHIFLFAYDLSTYMYDYEQSLD